MIKSGRYLFVVVFVGISCFFVGAVSAAYDAFLKKSGTPMDTQSTQASQKGEEVEFSWGVQISEGELDRSKQTGIAPEPDMDRPAQIGPGPDHNVGKALDSFVERPPKVDLPRGQQEGLMLNFEEIK